MNHYHEMEGKIYLPMIRSYYQLFLGQIIDIELQEYPIRTALRAPLGPNVATPNSQPLVAIYCIGDPRSVNTF
jgi:hypothetical protein